MARLPSGNPPRLLHCRVVLPLLETAVPATHPAQVNVGNEQFGKTLIAKGFFAASRMVRAPSQTDRRDEAVTAWKRAGEWTVPGDPPSLRHRVVLALALRGFDLQELDRHEEAIASWRKISDYARPDDPEDLRFAAALFICGLGHALAVEYDEAATSWERAAGYSHRAVPPERLQVVSGSLAKGASILCHAGERAAAETICGRILEVSLECGEAWRATGKRKTTPVGQQNSSRRAALRFSWSRMFWPFGASGRRP